MNNAGANKVMSKQECVTLIAGLLLTSCSEIMDTVSISGYYRIQEGKTFNLLQKYRDLDERESINLSFHQFVIKEKNKNSKEGSKLHIPHYVGGYTNHIYPPSEQHAHAMLLLHKPWNLKSRPLPQIDGSWVKSYLEFVNQDECPTDVKFGYANAKKSALLKFKKEPTQSAMNVDENCADNPDLKNYIEVMKSKAKDENDIPIESYLDKNLERGETFDWNANSTYAKNDEVSSNDNNMYIFY